MMENIRREDIYRETLEILRTALGDRNAEFRDHQYEAIESTVLNQRTLVVMKTGWGKSAVYFASTKYFRNHGKGITVVVSPLLSLMRNQADAAERFGLRAERLDSFTQKETPASEVFGKIGRKEVDILFTTPETLLNPRVAPWLDTLNASLFVCDEAHCISDWGHDFRLKYGKLKNILVGLPSDVHILATTATANDRVIDDLRVQFGGDIKTLRGDLCRESLMIDIKDLPTKEERYAWLLDHLDKELEGSGIIYCLTKHDCDTLTEFLTKNGIDARHYYSGALPEDYVPVDEDGTLKDSQYESECFNMESEELFMANKIKCLVATTKLGMGYDKPDIRFVVHFQMPQNLISYYQQIGRAGRDGRPAYCILMKGEEDERILDHFIETAFPPKEHMDAVMEVIENEPECTEAVIARNIDLAGKDIRKALYFLEEEGFISRQKVGGKQCWVLNIRKPYSYDSNHYEAVKAQKRKELEELNEFIGTDRCLTEFVAEKLDDTSAHRCGKCANCIHHELIPTAFSEEAWEKASHYMGLVHATDIIARKQGPDRRKIPGHLQMEDGHCLSKYGYGKWGELVRDGKYRTHGFSDELVRISAEMLVNFVKRNGIEYIVPVPSAHHRYVHDFCARLAERMGLTYLECLEPDPNGGERPQKEMSNSFHQYENARGKVRMAERSEKPSSNVLLVDDMVDSRWTMTACAEKILEDAAERNASIRVFPYALADSSRSDE